MRSSSSSRPFHYVKICQIQYHRDLPRDLLFRSDLLLLGFEGLTPNIFAAFADISGTLSARSGGGDKSPESMIADCLLELDRLMVLVRFSDVDLVLDTGGGENMLDSPRDFEGRSDLSAFSDAESREEFLSSLSLDRLLDLERFSSGSLGFSLLSGDFSLLGFLSSFLEDAPQFPHDEPSRTTFGRSFLAGVLGSGGGGGMRSSNNGASGTAETSGTSFGIDLDLLDLLFLLDFSTGISTMSMISSSGSIGSEGKLPGTAFDLLFFGDAFSSTGGSSFTFLDFEELDFFLSSLVDGKSGGGSSAGAGGGGGGGGGGVSDSFDVSNAFKRSAILPPTGFFVSPDAFIGVDDDFEVVVVSSTVVSRIRALSANRNLVLETSPLFGRFWCHSYPCLISWTQHPRN